MVDRSTWDPEMAAFAAAGDEEAKSHPPIQGAQNPKETMMI